MKSYGKRNDDLREVSGEVSYSDPLTTFLYLLMRNELAAGKVEGLVHESVEIAEEIEFTNGWLAHYANNLAEEIRNSGANYLQRALEKVFVDREEEKEAAQQEEQKEEIKKTLEIASENMEDGALDELENKLIQIAGVSKLTEKAKEIPETPEDAAKRTKSTVQQLVESGHMSQKDADDLKSDIDDLVEEEKDDEKPVGEAEEIVKEHTEEHKWSSEKAKEAVDAAIEAHESADEFDLNEATQMAVNLTEPIEVQREAKIEDDKGHEEEDKKSESEHWQYMSENIDLVREQNPEMSDETFALFKDAIQNEVTTVDVTDATEEDIGKWKATNEELQKQDQEETTTEEE